MGTQVFAIKNSHAHVAGSFFLTFMTRSLVVVPDVLCQSTNRGLINAVIAEVRTSPNLSDFPTSQEVD
jgi:hypothetical protein